MEGCDYRVPVWLTVYLQLEPGDELYFRQINMELRSLPWFSA